MESDKFCDMRFLSMFFIIRHFFKNNHDFKSGSIVGFPNPCIGYILNGSAEFMSEDVTLNLKIGDIVYIPKGQKYVSHWHGTPDIEFYSLNFEFNMIPQYSYMFQSLTVPYLKEIFDKIYNEYINGGNNSLLSLGYFYMLYYELSIMLKKYTLSNNTTAVMNAINHIKNNYCDDFSVDFLAKLCSLSESRFYTIFKKATGLTPIDYKNNIRIQHAVHYLNFTSNSIDWISNYLNFSSSAYMRKILKQFTGKTPTQIRKQTKSI